MDSGLPLSLFSAALLLAAFLPTLVYVFSLSLLSEAEEDGEFRHKAVYFTNAMDFIVTQSAYLVLMSAWIAVVVLIATSISTLICFYEKAVPGTLIIVGYFVYHHFSVKKSRSDIDKYYFRGPEGAGPERNKDEKVVRICWPELGRYQRVSYLSNRLYAVLGIGFSVGFIVSNSAKECLCVLIGLTSFYLIVWAISWVFPGFRYAPLWFLKVRNLTRDTNRTKG